MRHAIQAILALAAFTLMGMLNPAMAQPPGTLPANRFANYAPVDNVNEAGNIPMQFVVAENEELFDNNEHAILAHERYQGPKNLVIMPGIDHYGIYRQAWQQSNQLALEWFNQYL